MHLRSHTAVHAAVGLLRSHTAILRAHGTPALAPGLPLSPQRTCISHLHLAPGRPCGRRSPALAPGRPLSLQRSCPLLSLLFRFLRLFSCSLLGSLPPSLSAVSVAAPAGPCPPPSQPLPAVLCACRCVLRCLGLPVGPCSLPVSRVWARCPACTQGTLGTGQLPRSCRACGSGARGWGGDTPETPETPRPGGLGRIPRARGAAAGGGTRARLCRMALHTPRCTPHGARQPLAAAPAETERLASPGHPQRLPRRGPTPPASPFPGPGTTHHLCNKGKVRGRVPRVCWPARAAPWATAGPGTRDSRMETGPAPAGLEGRTRKDLRRVTHSPH